ncbi:MAG: CPBP family intramembrane glutamic endopeptidase [Chloroflexota bacterium]
MTGIAITFIVIGTTFIVFLGLGWIQIDGFARDILSLSTVLLNVAGMFFVFAMVGWSEELLSRGFHFRVIERGLNRFWGVFLSSAMFSYLHRNNPDITWGDLIIIFFFGLIMVYAYQKTDNLWLPIGLHAGWDFFVVTIFGEFRSEA